MKLGAQFFTVRDFCKNLEDFEETLKKVADIGYTEVQISGTCEYEADWLNGQLDKNGLKCCITHISGDKLINETDKVISDHKIFGCEHIGIGALPNGWNGITEEVYSDFVDKFSVVGQKIHNNGLQFMYHNHDIEFKHDENNRRYLDRLVEDFTPEQMGFTLDTYWIQAGGGDVIDWIKKLKGRIPCVHLKDMTYFPGEGKRMAPVGWGNMNFEGIIKACEGAGVEHLLVEQDNCYGEDPFNCLKKSYDYLKSLGLE